MDNIDKTITILEEGLKVLKLAIADSSKATPMQSGWFGTDTHRPDENTRILVRNEPGTEIFHTYSQVTSALFLKYKEWCLIPK